MLTPMRGAASWARLLSAIVSVALGACGGSGGQGADPPTAESIPAPGAAEPTWASLLVAGPLELAARDLVVERAGRMAVLVRVTNRGERPLLLDLRSVDRVVGPDVEAGLRLPLSDAQRTGLAEISALTQVPAGGSVVYGVALAAACEAGDALAYGGVLVALDEGRTLELTADGATAPVRCTPAAAPAGVVWVEGRAALAGEPMAVAAFAEGLPALLRAAAVSPEGDVALGELSYDARPIERWRYDACVAGGTCPARERPQPPGSLFAPAVGMTDAAASAFCAARSLRAMTAAEAAASVEPGRVLLADAPEGLVATGFRCARDEPAEPAAP